MASLLQKFTQAAHKISASVIGKESITISGGASISGILNEAGFSRDYEQGGFEQSASLSFVIDHTAFHASYPNAVKSYEGNSVSARGESWRIASISSGGATDGQFVTITLSANNKSA